RRRPFGHRRYFNEQIERAQRLSRSAFLLGGFLDLQLHEFFKDLLGVLARLHLLFDVQDFAILANDEGDSV
ncbi:MAG: hypothetical protein ACI93T_003458, partial [Porticoccaceae bacterium]